MAKKLILDVDAGTDDAVALLLAALHPDLELVAATTVRGNNAVVDCTDNTLRVFDLIDRPIPVHEGMGTPMVRGDYPVPRDPNDRSWEVHGRHLPIPAPRSTKQATHAVDFLIETYLAATEPIALVPVGPLTNVAMALKLEPRIVDRIPETVIMGGGHEVGNSTPAAEFNVWADPEAAQVVFRAGLRNLTLVPLDATHKALVTLDDCRRLRELATPASTAAADFQERRIHSYDEFQPMDVSHSAPIHDALAVAYLIDPTVVSGLRAHVDVEIHGELTVGRTIIDTDGRSRREPNAFVALGADTPTFVSLLLETLARR